MALLVGAKQIQSNELCHKSNFFYFYERETSASPFDKDNVWRSEIRVILSSGETEKYPFAGKIGQTPEIKMKHRNKIQHPSTIEKQL